MKKKVLTLALIAAGLFSFNAMATNPETNSNCSSQKTCCVKSGDKKAKGEGRKHKKGQRDEMTAFEGINLTDAQKTQITQLQEQRNAKRAEMKAQRQNTDSASVSRPDFRQARLDYFKAVSEILTPDQYVTFLENIAVGPQKAQSVKMDKQGRHGDKAQKGNKKSRHNKGERRSDRKPSTENQQS